jgi:hypothetical protein
MNSGAGELYPRRTQDGILLVFESFRDGHLEIYEMNSDESNQI